MPMEIRQTIVTPDAKGTASVQLHISDAPLEDASAAFVLRLSARIPLRPGALLVEAQRAALVAAREAMSPFLQEMADEIRKSGRST
jgi:hypothetical protein